MNFIPRIISNTDLTGKWIQDNDVYESWLAGRFTFHSRAFNCKIVRAIRVFNRKSMFSPEIHPGGTLIHLGILKSLWRRRDRYIALEICEKLLITRINLTCVNSISINVVSFQFWFCVFKNVIKLFVNFFLRIYFAFDIFN